MILIPYDIFLFIYNLIFEYNMELIKLKVFGNVLETSPRLERIESWRFYF